MKNLRKRFIQEDIKLDEISPPTPSHGGTTHLSDQDEGDLDFFKVRIMYLSSVLIIFFVLVIARLWYLQIQNGEYFDSLAYNNRVRSQEILAPRGNIFDRNNQEVVTNRPSFNVVWMRKNKKIDNSFLEIMAKILHVKVEDLLVRIRKNAHSPLHVPIILAEDIDWKTLAYVENKKPELPGIRIEVVPLRTYHFGDLASHLIGYLGQINEKELKKRKEEGYRPGDLIGKSGLEKLEQTTLRGEKGTSYSEVNAKGYEQRSLQDTEALPGNDIQLTIDMELQKIAENAMNAANKAGAVVVVEVNTGRLLTLASTPGLPLTKFVGGIPNAVWKSILDNPYKPLRNKIVQEHYPPGSTYKLITSLAGLAEGMITPDTIIFCPGHYKLGNRTYGCWKKSGHGPVNLNKAIAESCDVYFYSLGQRLGVDKLAEYASLFGLGHKTGIEMEHEQSGLVPSTSWKRRRYNEKWHEGETLSVAIGQGANNTTPLQICMMTSVVANGGTLYQPKVIEEIRDPDGKPIKKFTPQIKNKIVGQAKNLQQIRKGMISAVNDKHGTGKIVKFEKMIVAGKTGTAQVVRLKQYRHLHEDDIPYKYRDHAWFVCFAPAINPEIAVTVLVEHGLHGGSGAGPIARLVLEQYFAERLKEVDTMSFVSLPDFSEETLVNPQNNKIKVN
ncbi:MAG: penicillin-binding protein 2 [Desulfobulbaceae bacterium]|nr:penicillin-binding protein 2 [Desulfobulbaceae bacterium]